LPGENFGVSCRRKSFIYNDLHNLSQQLGDSVVANNSMAYPQFMPLAFDQSAEFAPSAPPMT
jgi:hypothetical protein